MLSPMQLPAMSVLDNGMYKSVNLDVAPSAQPSGLDLPLNDIATLRFFFNLGVHQSRVVLHSQQMAKTQQQQPQCLPFLPAAPPVAPALPTCLNLQQQLQVIQTSLQLQLKEQQAANTAAAASQQRLLSIPTTGLGILPQLSHQNYTTAVSKPVTLKDLQQQMYSQTTADISSRSHKTTEFAPAAIATEMRKEPAQVIGIVQPIPQRPTCFYSSPTSSSTPSFTDTVSHKTAQPEAFDQQRMLRKISAEATVVAAARLSSPADNPIFSHSESMFSSAFRKEDTPRQSIATVIGHDDKRQLMQNDDDDDKSGLCLMVSYLNSCLGKAKISLQRKGITVSTVDAKGMQVDFSSRPVDPIFRVARARLESERNYIDFPEVADAPVLSPSISPLKRPSSGSSASPSEKRLRIVVDDGVSSPAQIV